jgi:hypothetical protein
MSTSLDQPSEVFVPISSRISISIAFRGDKADPLEMRGPLASTTGSPVSPTADVMLRVPETDVGMTPDPVAWMLPTVTVISGALSAYEAAARNSKAVFVRINNLNLTRESALADEPARRTIRLLLSMRISCAERSP